MSDLPYLYPHIASGSRSLYSLVGSRPHFFLGFDSGLVHPPQASTLPSGEWRTCGFGIPKKESLPNSKPCCKTIGGTMSHGTFIRAVGLFPLKSCTLRHAELLVCSGSVESVKPPYPRGLATVIIYAQAAPFRSISSITAYVTNELGDPLSKSATGLYFL